MHVHASQQHRTLCYCADCCGLLRPQNADNEARKAAGKPVVSLEELTTKHPTFKPLPRPARLSGILMSKQIRYQSNQINAAANQSMYKLFLAEALQQSHSSGTPLDQDQDQGQDEVEI